MWILKASGAYGVILTCDFIHAHPFTPLPSALKLKGALAVFGFTDAGWISRGQIFQGGELIKVTGRFKRMKEGS